MGGSHTKTNDTTRHRHHPKHAINGNSMRCSSEYSTDDNHERSKNDGGLSTEIVASQTGFMSIRFLHSFRGRCSPYDNLTDNLTDQQRIRHTSAYGRCVLLWVFFLQKNIGHGPMSVV